MLPPAHILAYRFHEAYERLAPQFGYTTRSTSAVAWDDVPEPNRSLMVAVAEEVLVQLRSELRHWLSYSLLTPEEVEELMDLG